MIDDVALSQALFLGTAVLLLASTLSLFTIKWGMWKRPFERVPRKVWLILIGILALASVMRIFVFPHAHLMYADEFYYMDMASNMLDGKGLVVCRDVGPGTGEELCDPLLQKGPGWPTLIAGSFLIFGTDNYTALLLGSAMGVLGVLALFLLAFSLFENTRIALLASFMLAIHPLHILWSNTVETNSPALSFMLLALLLWIISLKEGNLRIAFCAGLFSLMAIVTRLDSIFVFALAGLAYLFIGSDRVATALRPWALSLTTLASIGIVLAHLALIPLFRPHFWETAMSHYLLNMPSVVGDIWFWGAVPLVICLPLLIKRKRIDDAALFVLSSLALSSIWVLAFYPGNRFALLPLSFVILSFAWSVENLRSMVAVKYLRHMVIISLVVFLVLMTWQEFHDQEEKYKINIIQTGIIQDLHDLEMADTEGCGVISEDPLMVTSSSSLRGIRTQDALSEPETIKRSAEGDGCILYLQDWFCTQRAPLPALGSAERCDAMKETFKLTKIISFHDEDDTLGIYHAAVQR